MAIYNIDIFPRKPYGHLKSIPCLQESSSHYTTTCVPIVSSNTLKDAPYLNQCVELFFPRPASVWSKDDFSMIKQPQHLH